MLQTTIASTLAAAPLAVLLLVVIVAFFLTLHRRRERLIAGTAPANFPPNPLMQVGQVQSGNKLGNTGAFSSEAIFTAPTTGWYGISWGVHINSTDNAGSVTLTVLPPDSVAVPGVQAAPGTPSDGKGPADPCYMLAGAQVLISAAVSGLTGTNYDVWVFAQRLS